MKYIDSQNHTLEEIASLVREAPVVFLTQQSRDRLANSLEELARFKNAAYEIRVALAKAEIAKT